MNPTCHLERQTGDCVALLHRCAWRFAMRASLHQARQDGVARLDPD